MLHHYQCYRVYRVYLILLYYGGFFVTLMKRKFEYIYIYIYIYTGAGHIIRISSKSWFISLIPFKKWNLYNVFIHSTQTDIFQVFISFNFDDYKWQLMKINREAKGRKRCGRKKCTINRDNRTLERTVKQNPFKNVGEIHKEWTAAGVSASRTTTHRRMQDMGFSCRIPCVKPLLNNRQRQKRLTLV